MCLNPRLVPIRVPYSQRNDIGVSTIRFRDRETGFVVPALGRIITVPCGKCIECSKMQSTEWALRICLESMQHDSNCVVTLTYNDSNLPLNSLLEPRDLQLWLKRLRKAISPVRVRFFASGEYGSLKGRPHYHVILFGWAPSDLEFMYSTAKNSSQYRSRFLDKLWGKGFVSVGMVDWNTAYYTAKYLQKVVFSDCPVPPFVRMSNRPGIGYGAIKDVKLQIGKLYYRGREFPLPRYFVKVLTRQFGEFASDLLLRRRSAVLARLRRECELPLKLNEERYSVRLARAAGFLGQLMRPK